MPKSQYNVGGKKKQAANNATASLSGRGRFRRTLLSMGVLVMCVCFAQFRSITDQILSGIQIISIHELIPGSSAFDNKINNEGKYESTVCVRQDEIDKNSLLNARITFEQEDPDTVARSEPHNNQAKGDTASTLRQDYNGGNPIACRVLVANHADYHYELIESVILKYPLPWDEMPCDFSKSNVVVFDVAMVLYPSKAKELPAFKPYYYSYLQGGVPRRRMVAESKRNTGVNNEKYENVMAVMGDVGSPWEMEKYEGIYAAQIAVSCGTIDPKGFVNRSPFHFCVQHLSCDATETFCDENTRKRSCWLSPMHNRTCYFLADVFPMFPDSEQCQKQPQTNDNNNNNKLRLCTVGSAKHHGKLAAVFGADANYYRQHVKLYIHHRFGMLQDYVINKVEDVVVIANHSSFIGFQQSVSKCDILLPLLFPVGGMMGYFHFNRKSLKLSGSMSQLIAYHLPSVMHKDIYDSYKDVLTAPATTHDMTEESLDRALKQMIQTVTQEREKPCNHIHNFVRGRQCLPPLPLQPQLQQKLVASAKKGF